MSENHADGSDASTGSCYERIADGVGDTRCIDALLDALSDRCRRRVVYDLRSRGRERVPAETLARTVVADPATDVSDPETAAIQLRHRHLPMLDAAGLIEYDRERRTVAYAGDDRAGAFVDFVSEAERRGRRGERGA